MDFAAMTAAQEGKHQKEMMTVLRAFLSVVDSLQALEAHCRGLIASGQKHVPARSVTVTLRQALQALARSGVEPMNAVGTKLNLDFHEVVAVSATSQEESDTVVEEAQSGYLWSGRLLRRAKVIVSSGPETERPSKGENK
jgi:molecular chaperone GrpE